jgi:hypothetical protein
LTAERENPANAPAKRRERAIDAAVTRHMRGADAPLARHLRDSDAPLARPAGDSDAPVALHKVTGKSHQRHRVDPTRCHRLTRERASTVADRIRAGVIGQREGEGRSASQGTLA